MTLRFGGHHAAGPVRQHDEDRCGGRLLGPDEGVFVVADGMGGITAGDVHAEATVEELLGSLSQVRSLTPEGAQGAARVALEVVNRRLEAQGMGDAGAGSTVVWAVVHGSSAQIAWLGDCRGWRLRGGALKQLTRDHTLVQKMVDSGRITAEEAVDHPHRSIVLRSFLGEFQLPNSAPETVMVELEAGDRLVLATDGVWNALEPEVIAQTAALKDVQEAAELLVELAHLRDGKDNAGAVVVEVG